MKKYVLPPDTVLPAGTHIVYKAFDRRGAYEIYLKALRFMSDEAEDFEIPTSLIFGVTYAEWCAYDQAKREAVDSMLLHLIHHQFVDLDLDAAYDSFHYVWIPRSKRPQRLIRLSTDGLAV